MIIYGYAKETRYSNDSTLQVQVRIPSIHGPYSVQDAKGKTIHNYVQDMDLPFYPSLLLPHMPNEGDVVALTNTDANNTDFVVIGLTGGSYAQQSLL